MRVSDWIRSRTKLGALLLLFLALPGTGSLAATTGAEPCWPFSPQEFFASICGSIRDIDQLHQILEWFPLLPKAPRKNCGIRHERYDVCTSCDDAVTPDQVQALQEIFSEPQHQQHHADWHEIRATYLTASADKRREWASRGELDFGSGDAVDHLLGGRLAGEDFLFMHREMIKMAQIQLAVRGLGCIAPWKAVPARANDPLFPVPQIAALYGKSPNMPNVAGDQFAELIRRSGSGQVDVKNATVGQQYAAAQQILQSLQGLDQTFRDPNWLRTHSLNELGDALDGKVAVSFHAALHALYDSHDFCVKGGSKPEQNCASMADFRFSAENPYFWKIHGLIDEYLSLWLDANGYSEVSRDCGSPARPGCYQWQGTWAGKMPFQAGSSSRR